jgi:thiamine transporter
MLQGGVFGWGLTSSVLIAAILLDYILAFTAMCLSGLWRNKGFWGIIEGTALAVFARFVCHFASGVVLWTSFDIFNNPYIYSLVYNGAYMLPELIFTMVGTYALYKTTGIKAINKLVK